MLTTLHWEGKPSNLTYHYNRSLFFYYFFLLNGDKWPFRFVALKFKCTNIYKQCFIKKGGEGWGGKGEELVTWKNEENYPFGGRGWKKKGNNLCGGSSNTHIFQTLTKGEHLKHWLWNSLQWPNYVINLVGNTKLQCYTLPSMQFYGFIRNLPPLFISNCFAHVFNISKGQNLF